MLNIPLEWFARKNKDVVFIFVLEDLFPKVPIGAKNIFTIPYKTLKLNIHRIYIEFLKISEVKV
jgi:hypothetical protein